MSRYRRNPAAVRALVRDDAVHRDVYIDPKLFALEMEKLGRRPGSMSATRARCRTLATITPATLAPSR